MFDQVQCSPGFEHPADFAQGGKLVGNTAKCPGHEDGIDLMVIEGQPGCVLAEEFDPGMASLHAGAGQFERAGGRLDRQDFLDIHWQVGEIQPGAEANFNEPATQADHDLTAQVEEFPTRQQSIGQKRKDMVTIDWHQPVQKNQINPALAVQLVLVSSMGNSQEA